MSPTTTLTDPRHLAPHGHPGRRIGTAQRKPTVIRPFAAPVVREIPPRRTAAGTAW